MTERYTYVWEFLGPVRLRGRVRTALRHQRHLGSAIRTGDGLLETLLLKDDAIAGRYLTVDRWADEEAYQAFRSAYSRQYEQLDQQCAKLTTAETLVGRVHGARRMSVYPVCVNHG